MLLGSSAAVAAVCERPTGWTGAQRITGKTWQVWWQSSPAAVPLGAHFSVRLHFCGPVVRRIKLRGWMPDHQHGMNYRPTITRSGMAAQAKGLLFHMPGKWQLILDIAGSGKREKLIATMVLE